MEKLIKIKEDHYVVVDDSEIKEGDWYIDDTLQILQALPPRKDWINSGKNGYIICKKITHSTFSSVIDLYKPNTPLILNLSEVKELIGEVDVEKKAAQNSDTYQKELGYIKGYNQALEDNKEKKYTEEDLRNAYRHGTTVNHGTKEHFNSFIQSLQPKTEWKVEIVDGKLKLK